MQNKKHKLAIGLLSTCFILTVGNKNVMANSVSEDLVAVEFKMTSEEDSGKKYKYISVDGTEIKNSFNGKVIKVLKEGVELQPLELNKDYGVFMTLDGTKGTVLLNTLEKVERNLGQQGYSKINKVLKSGNKIHTLLKGEPVNIKEKVEGHYIVLSNEGAEFKIQEGNIEFKDVKKTSSRGGSLKSSKVDSINKLMVEAYDALGSPYASAGTGSNGYDCSGLTFALYKNNLGITLPRSSSSQVSAGTSVKKSELVPGDLIFFKGSSLKSDNIGHVGIYIGDNQMIHASSGKRQVMISDIDEKYYKQRYVTSKRIID